MTPAVHQPTVGKDRRTIVQELDEDFATSLSQMRSQRTCTGRKVVEAAQPHLSMQGTIAYCTLNKQMYTYVCTRMQMYS